MATRFPNDQSNAHAARIKRLILTPESEWAAIDTETMSATRLFFAWAVPLAAIGPAAQCVKSILFGTDLLGFHYQPSVAMAVATALSAYAMALIGVGVLALAIDALAPSFGGTRDATQAMKVAIFSMVPVWLAGLLALIPFFSFLAYAGLYGLYLVYLGLPRLMRASSDKALVYVAAVVALGFALMLVGASVASGIGNLFAAPGTVVG